MPVNSCAYSPPDTVTGALGHDWGLWISRQDGSHARVCQRDNSHEETGGCVYADTVTPPSCTEEGNTLHLCGVCGYSLTDAQTDALGHQWGEWLDQQDGTHLRTCQRDPGHLDTAPCEYLALVTPPPAKRRDLPPIPAGSAATTIRMRLWRPGGMCGPPGPATKRAATPASACGIQPMLKPGLAAIRTG